MNVKITKEEHNRLCSYKEGEVLVGSCMYGTDNYKSDKDYLCFYSEKVFDSVDMSANMLAQGLPNIHQFQYDNIEDHYQVNWTTTKQFLRNLWSGDSTINVDAVLFGYGQLPNELMVLFGTPENRLAYCRTYKIIKSFLGFAKRDLNRYHKNENTSFHAVRSCYMADCLLKSKYPSIKQIQDIKKNINTCRVRSYKELVSELRYKANRLLDSGELQMYYVPAESKDKLFNKLIQSNNKREFKYE